MLKIVKGLRRVGRIPLDHYRAKLEARFIDPNSGHPVPDPTPMAPPIGYKKQPSMVELVREMVRSERLRQEAESAGMETFEESEDFDIDDDPQELKSGWENDFDPPIEEIKKEVETERSKKAQKPPPQPQPPEKAPEGPGVEGGQAPLR